MNKRKRRWLIALVLGLAVAALALWRTDKYIEMPGSAETMKPYVTVAGKRDKAKGDFLLTTVGILGPATPLELLVAQLRPYTEVVTQEALMGDDDQEAYNLLQDYYIKSAANNATVAAFGAAKRPVTIKHKGIYVMSIMAQSPFKAQLKLGDTITAVDGKHYQTADDYVAAIKAKPVGQKVTITYVRGKQAKQASGKLIQLPGTKQAGIGITLTAHTEVVSSPKVAIDAGDIGGPSAGLMFAVQVYSMLTKQDLRHGATIAGTGTIDADGQVGQIGGIDKKVYVASKEGASVFFAPDQPATAAIKKLDPSYENNYAVAKRTAKAIGTKMKIVPVKTLSDALKYLKAQ